MLVAISVQAVGWVGWEPQIIEFERQYLLKVGHLVDYSLPSSLRIETSKTLHKFGEGEA